MGRSEPCACLCPEQCYSFYQTLGEIPNHIDLEVVHPSIKDSAPGRLQAAHTPLSLLGQAWEGSFSVSGVAEGACGLWELSYHADRGHAWRWESCGPGGTAASVRRGTGIAPTRPSPPRHACVLRGTSWGSPSAVYTTSLQLWPRGGMGSPSSPPQPS